MNKVITLLALATLTAACEVDSEGYLVPSEGVTCEIGVTLDTEANKATVSTCGEVNTTVETWVDLYNCDGTLLPWSRSIVVSTDFDAYFEGSYTFSHYGVDDRDVRDMGADAEACYVTWQMLETYQDDKGIIRYTGEIASEGYNELF